jgi:hypothetical protein
VHISRFARALAPAILCASGTCDGADRVDLPDVQLVEYAGRTAAFLVDGRLLVVGEGDVVPKTRATLRHVGANEIFLEYPANAESPGAIIEVERGASIAASVSQPADVQEDLVPVITIPPAGKGKGDSR